MATRPIRGNYGTIRLAFSTVGRAGARELSIILGGTVVTAIAVAAQLLVGRALLDLLVDDDRVEAGELAPYIVLLGALMIVSALSQALANEMRIPLSEKVLRRTMDEILDVATEAPFERYEESAFFDRLQRARVSASVRTSAVVFGLVAIISTVMVATGVVFVLVTVVPILVPISLMAYLPIAWVNVRNNRARYRLEVEMTELVRDRTYLESVMTEREDAKEVRVFHTAPALRRWHSGLWETRLTGVRELVRKRLTLGVVGTVVTTAVLVATLAFALVLAGRGSISVGDAAVAIVGLQQLNGRLQSLGSAFGGVHEGITFLRDFESFRADLPLIRDQRPRATPPTPPRSLRVENLHYGYPGADHEALRSVSFEIERGQVMAVVGANGSGKSTLAKVLCGLLTPRTGTVSWDGVDLGACDPDLVRAQIAPVFQDYSHYFLTIRQAIGLGDVDGLDDDDRLMTAARQAGLDDVIAVQPRGLETRLGKMFKGGVDLSTGQWQRLAIARALFRGAPVVVLDEPSASLDPRAEADLFDLLQELCADRIVLYVSHRFATVRSADQVLVLDQGEVVELGGHDELMAANRLYADLFTLQAERYGIRGA